MTRPGIADPLPLELLLAAYAKGIFPMVHDDGEIYWHDPDPRAIFDLETLKADGRTARVIRSGRYRTTLDADFAGVIRACAQRDETWIDERMITSYMDLHRAGHAVSVEAWEDHRLAGGIYGVVIDRAFFGESKFGRNNAGKVAFYALIDHLRERGFTLFDTQYINDFTRALGAFEVPRPEFKRLLRESLQAAPY